MRITNPVRVLRAGLVALAIAGAQHVSAQTAPRMKATLGVGGSSTQIALLAMNIARTKGFIRDEGLDLEVTDFGSGAKGLQALIGRNVDMVAGVHEHPIRMHAKGMDIRSIVAYSNAPGIVVGVTKAFAPKFKDIRDLKGAKIGVSAPGSATHLLLNTLLVQAGMKPEDVSVIGVGNTAGAVAAIRTGGELQAIVNYDPVITELEQSGDIRVVVDTRTAEGTRAIYKNEYVFLTVYAHADFIEKRADAAQALVNGIVRALVWMQTAKPEEMLAAVPEAYWKANRDLYLKTIAKGAGGFSRDGRITPAAVKTVYEGLAAYDRDVQGAKIDLAKTYETRFVDRALEKYGRR